MTDEKLEQLLRQEFQSEMLNVPSQLVYETKQKVYIIKEKQQKESIRALIYGIVLHVLWMVVLLSLTYGLEGSSMAVLIGFGSLGISAILIIGVCMIVPYIQKVNKEVGR